MIGLLLVVLYSLAQYRLLGLVTVASIVVAGAPARPDGSASPALERRTKSKATQPALAAYRPGSYNISARRSDSKAAKSSSIA